MGIRVLLSDLGIVTRQSCPKSQIRLHDQAEKGPVVYPLSSHHAHL